MRRLQILLVLLALMSLTIVMAGAKALPAHAANGPFAGLAATPDGGGNWLVASTGAVSTVGDANSYGSLDGKTLARPIVGMAATPDGGGYWLVASDGGIFSFGDAGFFGSAGSQRLNKPIVGMASTPDGGGYWLVASDGGIFSFGDARFFGSAGAINLSRPIVGMAATPDGGGYWLVASDGGIFSFGDAGFFGSTGAEHLNKPIVGMASTPDGDGYWLAASDGGIFSFGTAPFLGSAAGISPSPVAAIARRGAGYVLLMTDGQTSSYDDPASTSNLKSPKAPTTTSPTTVDPTATSTTTTEPEGTNQLVGSASTASVNSLPGLDYSQLPVGPWTMGQTYGAWRPVFDGYGSMGVEADPSTSANVLSMQPQASTSPAETHSALAVTNATQSDFNFSVQVQTVSQLRTGSAPNPWETGWVLWHYTDNTHFYYFIPKPTGWELGKEDPAYPGAQRFLATGTSPTFPTGGTYTVRVQQAGATMTVWVDGVQITQFTDTESPYSSGSLGLYCEDSLVHFSGPNLS
jgi:hypothetical protein